MTSHFHRRRNTSVNDEDDDEEGNKKQHYTNKQTSSQQPFKMVIPIPILTSFPSLFNMSYSRRIHLKLKL